MLVFLDACCGVRRDSPDQSPHFSCVHFLEKLSAFDCSSFFFKYLAWMTSLSGNQSGSPPAVSYTLLYCEMVRGKYSSSGISWPKVLFAVACVQPWVQAVNFRSSTVGILFANQMPRWKPLHHCMLSFVDVQSGSPRCVTVVLLLYLTTFWLSALCSTLTFFFYLTAQNVHVTQQEIDLPLVTHL